MLKRSLIFVHRWLGVALCLFFLLWFRSGRGETIVYADTGERQREVTSEMRARAAAAWAHDRGSARSVETLLEANQWTVQGSFASHRPLTKFSWPDGEQIY